MTQKLLFFFFSLLGLNAVMYAGVVINGTRVVYPAGEKEVTIQLNNDSKLPSLVQSWIDHSDEKLNKEGNYPVPFVLVPPMSRVEPGKGQTLRILYTGEALPQDKETLFYLNVLDIPPKPAQESTDKSGDYLQISVRSRLKLFFRPKGLKISIEDAPEAVSWCVYKASGGKWLLKAKNATPYYITYREASLIDGKEYPIKEIDMLSPGSETDFSVAAIKSLSNLSVRYTIVNDYGGATKGQAIVKSLC